MNTTLINVVYRGSPCVVVRQADVDVGLIASAFARARIAAQIAAQMKKARRIRQALINLVAGAGFEPTTFGL